MDKRNIVVVGGGTAGWMSGLAAKKRFPSDNVIVIESTEIGILGAGEGTVPLVLKFFEDLGITLKDLISNTNSTIKNGIKFVNWSKDNNHYYHGFDLADRIVEPEGLVPLNFKYKKFPYVKLFSYAKDIKDSEHCFSTMISEKNKVSYLSEDINKSKAGSHAMHFDARVLAKYLKERSLENNIVHIDAKVINVDLNEKIITKIYLDNGQNIDIDFLIDATGFTKHFIGKILNEKWISYSDYLPANSAQAFFLKIKDLKQLEPYTESIAMDHGWIWKIPLQHRYGCGYVYDSKIISNEDVKKQIVDKYGDVEFVKEFNFDPGHFENIWVENCVAVGLAAGFIEPLEATSLQQTATTLIRIFSEDVDVFNPGAYIEKINKMTYDDSDGIRDFIYLHYVTNKNNTDFWKNFIINNPMPDSFIKIFKSINNLEPLSVYDDLWYDFSYYVVANGNGILDKNKLIDFYNLNIENNLNNIKNNLNVKKNFAEKMISHYDFLKLNGGFNE